MILNIRATNTTLTPAIKDFIEQRLQGLSKLVKESDKIFVELQIDKKHKTGLVCRTEISVNPPKYYAESRGGDFYEAMDLLVPKIKEQLVKAKDKKVSLRRKTGK